MKRFGVWSLAACSAAGLHAQSAQSPAVDTGGFARGVRLASRYNTVELCIAAAHNTTRASRRVYDVQMPALRARVTATQDTLPRTTIELARQCLAQFPVTRVVTADLPDLVTLALLANRDTIANAAGDRWMSSVASPAARDTVLLAIMEQYLTAEPARSAAAASLVGRVTQSGAAGIRWRAAAMSRMLSYWSDTFDQAEMRQWADRLVALVDSTPTPQLRGLQWSAAQGYATLSKLRYVAGATDTREIAERALRTVQRFEPDPNYPMPWQDRTPTIDDIVTLLDPFRTSREFLGKTYPVLHAEHWYPAKPNARDTVVTLVISVEADGGGRTAMYSGERCLQGDGEMFPGMVLQCESLYEEIRTLATRYASQGVRVVVLAGTHGNTVRSLPLSPAQEADRLRWFFLDYLKLPVTLAVVERPLDSLPLPDGRRWSRPICDRSPQALANHSDTSALACQYLAQPVVMLDARGALVYRGNIDPVFDIALLRAIGKTSDLAGNQHE